MIRKTYRKVVAVVTWGPPRIRSIFCHVRQSPRIGDVAVYVMSALRGIESFLGHGRDAGNVDACVDEGVAVHVEEGFGKRGHFAAFVQPRPAVRPADHAQVREGERVCALGKDSSTSGLLGAIERISQTSNDAVDAGFEVHSARTASLRCIATHTCGRSFSVVRERALRCCNQRIMRRRLHSE